MFAPVAVPLVMASLVLAADRPPTFNVEPSCRGAATQGIPGADVTICLRKELDARDQLVKQWSEFAASDKSYCVPLSSLGGRPTYTELLTCLDIARAVRKLRAEQGDALKRPKP